MRLLVFKGTVWYRNGIAGFFNRKTAGMERRKGNGRGGGFGEIGGRNEMYFSGWNGDIIIMENLRSMEEEKKGDGEFNDGRRVYVNALKSYTNRERFMVDIEQLFHRHLDVDEENSIAELVVLTSYVWGEKPLLDHLFKNKVPCTIFKDAK